MALAALRLSGIAVLAALASALYTRQQTAHAKRSADIEVARRDEELQARHEADLAARRANLRFHVQREENRDGSLAAGPFRHTLIVTNDGPAEAHDVTIEILTAWNNPLGTRACFDDGERMRRVGRVPVGREVLPLKDDREVDFADIGECDVRWRDDSGQGLQARIPARPNWT